MTKQEYLDQRKVLVDEAQVLITDGKLEDSTVKMGEVTALDNKFEEQGKAQANLNALQGNRSVANPVMGNVAGHVVDSTVGANVAAEPDDIYASNEYKKAFMNHVLRGTAIPSQFLNVDANTKTTDVGSVIPTETMEKIIEKMESIGMILPLVTKTSFKGGLEIPTSTVKPVATWVAEGATSDKQKKTTGTISFGYHKLRCAISSSLEVDTMAYNVFELTFVKNAADAMVKAQEQAIVSGSGEGQPKGILAETVVSGQNVDIAATAEPTYATLIAAEAALPLAYENDALWWMTKKTFMGFVGMVDDNKQPIARTNYGIGGKPERTLLGRTVLLNDYMTSLTLTVAADAVVAFLFNPADYAMNTNLQMTIKKYEDNDTDDMITKAIMLVDGKVIDKNSLVTITKKVAVG